MHRIVKYAVENPNSSAREISAAIGVSRARVYQVLSSAGIKPAARKPDQTKRNHTESSQKNRRHMIGGKKINSSTIGDMSEIIASSDLLRKGAYVFRSMTASCPCDLVAMAGNVISRVEVKTARVYEDGVWSFLRPPKDTYDILCAVCRDTGMVKYWPNQGHEWVNDQ